MPRPRTISCRFGEPHPIRSALAALLLLAGGSAEARAQALAEGPEPWIVPRGEVVAGASALLHRADRVYRDGEPIPLGSAFFLPSLDPGTVPELAPPEAQLQSLAGGSPPSLLLGGTAGRLSLEDDVVPLSLRYGVTGRITAGATLPIVRRRVDALLRYTPSGANIGRNPALTAAPTVSAFLSQAGASLTQTSTAVDGYCGGAGEMDPQCVGGRALVQSATTYLSTLNDLYAGGTLFPSDGTDLGNATAAAWAALAQGFADWGAPDPGALPLATAPLTEAEFRALVIAPAWGTTGLPATTAPPFFDVGDLEFHGAVRLVGPTPGSAAGANGRGPAGSASAARERGPLLLDLAVTLRVPTGSPDSLRALAPTARTDGVAGVQVALAGDLRGGAPLSLGWMAEVEWNGSRDGVLLLPDPTRPFSPGQTRVRVAFSPGADQRVALSPRVHLGPTLSLAARWEWLRRGADTFEVLDSPAPALPTGSARTLQAVGFEVRFDGFEPSARSGTVRPFAAFLRFSGTVAGSDGFAVVRSVEGGLAVAVRR